MERFIRHTYEPLKGRARMADSTVAMEVLPMCRTKAAYSGLATAGETR